MATGPRGGDRQEVAGGIEGWGFVSEAARLDALGLNGERYLATSDPAVRLSMVARAKHLAESREIEQHNLAVAIVDELAKAWNRK